MAKKDFSCEFLEERLHIHKNLIEEYTLMLARGDMGQLGRIKQLREMLGESYRNIEDMLDFQKEYVFDLMCRWYDDDGIITLSDLSPILKDSRLHDYEEMEGSVKPGKIEYTLTPETYCKIFKKFPADAFKVVRVPEDMYDTSIAEKIKWLVREYGDEYYFPDIRFMDWIDQWHQKMHQSIEDEHNAGIDEFVCPGALIRNLAGVWNVLSFSFGDVVYRFEVNDRRINMDGWFQSLGFLLIKRPPYV